MSEVKRYEMKTTYRGHESWDSLEEDKDGGYVNYEDYAALETKCAALVEENAGMSARTPVAYSYRYAGCETCEGFQDWRWELSKEKPPEWMLATGKVTNLVELFELPETPATDASLLKLNAKQSESSLTALNTSCVTSYHRMTLK